MKDLTLTRARKIAFVVFVSLLLGLAASAFTPAGQRVAAQYLSKQLLARLAARPVMTTAVPMFATLTVTNTNDSGAGSLRQAITDAVAGDTITFSVTGTITLASELAINQNLTIQGPGVNALTISGNNASRVFNIAAGNYNVAISNLTIANGRARGANGPNSSTPGGDGEGGGIYNASTGTLTLTNCVLSSNTAAGGSGFGGPTASAGGHARGGGIFNASTGRIDITNSTLSSNAATGGAGGSGAAGRNGGNGDGGGIYNASTGMVSLTNSTLSSNSATGGAGGAGSNNTNGGSATGGGIHNASTGRVDITNSTLSGNSATGDKGGQGSTGGTGGNGFGGGVYNAGTGEVNLFNSTLTLNSIMAGAGGSPSGASGSGNGSGVYNNGTGTFKVRSAIIAGNANSGVILDAQGTFTSQGYNFIGDGQTAIGFGGPADQVGGHLIPLNPQLGPLANNGGPTQTHRPLANSLAIDKGNSFGLTIDQRGFSRTIDNPAISNAGDGTDIGSVELLCDSPTTNPLVLTINPASNPNGAAQELLNAINCANDDPAATTIQLACGTYSYSTANNWEFGPNALPIIQSNITIQGNGAILNSTATTRLRFFYVAGQNVGGLTSGTLTLQDLTLQNGKQKGGDSGTGGGGMGAGGAIFNHGNVTLERVTLNGNSALGGSNGVSGPGQGGGGMGEDALTSGNGGGFGGTPIGAGGSKGTSGGGVSNPFGGGGGGGFRAGDNGTNGVTGGLGGNGGGQGLLGGRGGVLSTSVPGAGGDGGGGGENQPNGGPEFGGAGGDYGFGGLGGNNGSGGGGVGGGGGYGGGSSRYGGGGGFGGGGGRGDSPGSGADGGFGGGGGSNAGASRFAGGNRSGGGAGLGGAIFNHLGTLTLTNCTLTGNTAQGGTSLRDGGSGLGGAVFNLNGTVTITSSTLAANTVTAGTTSSAPTFSEGQADGGAVYNLAFGNTFTGGATTATVTLSNSILANSLGGTNELVNDKRDGANTNTATVTFNNGNLVMAKTSLNSATESGNPTLSSNPNLGALTVLSNCVAGTCKPAVLPLLAGSPALNAASGTSPATDQTGTVRPQGSLSDLGAYELCCPPITVFDVTGGGAFCAGGTGVAIGLSGSQTGVTYQLVLNGMTDVGAAVPGTGMALSFGNQTTAGTYTVVALSSVQGCASRNMNNNAAVTINPVPLPIIDGGNEACANATNLSFNGNGGASSYLWEISGSGSIVGATNGQFVNVTAGASGSFTLKLTLSNGFGCFASTTKTVTINPTTMTTALTTQTICQGGDVSFTTTASGTGPFSFVWKKGASVINTGINTMGNTSTLTLNNVQPSDASSYTVEVAGTCGTATQSSTLTVNTPPSVTTNPQPQNVNPGDMATFTAAASGTPTPTVQWQVSTDNGMNFTDIPGEMNTTLSFTTMASQNGYLYRAVFTNSCGIVNTPAALLTLCTPPTVTMQPVNQIVGQNATATFTADVSSSPAPTVQWQVDTGTGFNDIPGATNATLNVPNVTPAMNGYRYRAVFTNPCGMATSDPAILTVNPFKIEIGDPLLCLNVGGLVGVTVTITNNNAAPVNANFTATLPTTLNGLPGTGLASQPGVVNVTAAAVTWMGIIPANTTVTITYKAQIVAGTPANQPICVDSEVIFNGGPRATVQECQVLNCPANGVVKVSDQKPGALLVFPYYVSKAAEKKDTRMTISNISDKPITAHVFFIDGTTCQQADQFLCLTPFASFTFKASEQDPEAVGWLLVVAVDAQGRPAQLNGLIGNAFVNDGGYVDNYGAESFKANSPLLATFTTDTATLFFDNQSYDAVPNQFAMEIQSPLDAPNQRVVMVGLQGDLTKSTVNGASQVGVGTVINGNEKPMGSFVTWLNGNCQAQAMITPTTPRVPSGMNGMIPKGQVGTMQWRIGAGVGLLMTPRNAPWNGIRTLHKVGSTATTLTIPLIQPVC